MKGEIDNMKLMCENKTIHLRMDISEKNSMLITGGSRTGKTFLASNLAADLVRTGKTVHLIDLGEKWSLQDKNRLYAAGALEQKAENQGVRLVFGSKTELTGCVKYITSALGIRSIAAQSALKIVFQQLLDRINVFSFQNLFNELEIRKALGIDGDSIKWMEILCERIDSCGDIPDIHFSVWKDDNQFSNSSMIWDLAELDETYVKMAASLITYCLYCQKKREFKNGNKSDQLFIIIDEFQNLGCDKKSIIGTCLTEGQKYGLNLVLITQFLNGNFSDAVIAQFKQGGFRFHFRLTEEEANIISKQLSYNNQSQMILYQCLKTLPKGSCILLGPHSVGNRQDISEEFRFLEVVEGKS